MGLFDRRKRTEDLDEVEEVVKSSDIVTEAVRAKSVNSDQTPAEPPPPAKVPTHGVISAPATSGSTQVSVTPVKNPPPPPPHLQAAPSSLPTPNVPAGGFGIDEALQLARQLPNRNIELVMQVVKKTLEALHVDVPRIVDSAQKKEQAIEERIAGLKRDIERLEGQIAAAKKEIGQLEGDHKEVATLKERLVMAQKADAAETERALPSPIPAHTPKPTEAKAPTGLAAASPLPPPATTQTGPAPTPVAAPAAASAPAVSAAPVKS